MYGAHDVPVEAVPDARIVESTALASALRNSRRRSSPRLSVVGRPHRADERYTCVLPVMRRQRAGPIISISSSAGLAAGFDFVSAYAASKFGLEGWMESLHAEVAPFGIATTVVNPGFFPHGAPHGAIHELRGAVHRGLRRTPRAVGRLLEIAERTESGDPAKLARALITIAGQEPPPRRFIAGSDAIATAEQKIADLKTQIDANRDLSTSLALDGEEPDL
jgi:hypothetical protein